MTLDEQIENELAFMRRNRRTEPLPVHEPREGTVIERLVRAAMPSVVRDMKERRAAAAAIRKAQEKQDKATSIFFQQQTPREFDGDVAYEQSVPDFV